MKGWKIIFVLLAVVILLGVILGVKIINNTPEKQYQASLDSYNEKQEQNLNRYDNLKADDIFEEIRKNAQKRALKQNAGKLVIAALIGGFFVYCNVKVYSKLGIEGLPIKLWVLSCILSFLVIFTLNDRLSNMMGIISGILSVILLIMQYKVIGINPWLLLLALIPAVGILAAAIVIIYGQCKLGAYFGKGTGFQLGLIFLPVIFIPILALSQDV